MIEQSATPLPSSISSVAFVDGSLVVTIWDDDSTPPDDNPVTPPSGPSVEGEFETQAVASGLSLPTLIDWLPDGRMLVAEQAGVVRVVNTDGSIDSQPFIDIRDRVNTSHSIGDLEFGADGNLYAAVGDGGSFGRGDPINLRSLDSDTISRLVFEES